MTSCAQHPATTARRADREPPMDRTDLAILRVLQREGGKAITAADYLNGRPDLRGG